MATEYRSADSGDNGNATVDPVEVDAAGTQPAAEPVRTGKRRGRPPGSGAGAGSGGTASRATRKADKVALDLSAIEGMFVGVHVLLAERTDTPELAISPEEGKQFMTAVQNVMRHYSVQTTQKTLDFVALFGTVSTIYAPRIVAVNMRKKANRQPMKAPSFGKGKPGDDANGSIVPAQYPTGFQDLGFNG